MTFIRILILLIFQFAFENRAGASFDLQDNNVKKVIFSYKNLDAIDLCRCSRVSRAFKAIADSNEAWSHLKPNRNPEVAGLILEYCPSVKESWHMVYNGMDLQESFEKASFKKQYLFYQHLALNRDMHSSEIVSFVSDIYMKVIIVSNKNTMEQIYVFSESYGCDFTTEYISHLEIAFMDLIIGQTETEVIKAQFSSMWLIHKRLIRMGSKLALIKENELKENMLMYRVKFEPDKNQ